MEKTYVADNPELLSQWDYEKNDALGFDPAMITLGSSRKVWWRCSKGHSWKATVFNRNHGTRCPFCCGRFVLPETSFAAFYPELAAQWDREKNGELTPETVHPHSTKRVWWVCEKGHSWRATIINRSHGTGCPCCLGRSPRKK